MRFKPGLYRNLQNNNTIEQVADTAINLSTWAMAGFCIVIFFLLIQVRQAQAAEDAWRHEMPPSERNLWVYWDEGRCTRWAKYDPELGFHTSRGEAIEAKWWLYVIGDDPPPVEFCYYE